MPGYSCIVLWNENYTKSVQYKSEELNLGKDLHDVHFWSTLHQVKYMQSGSFILSLFKGSGDLTQDPVMLMEQNLIPD